MSDFTYPASWGSENDEEPSVLSAKFGDGYEQRASDGINSNLQVWPLRFEVRTASEADAIIAFFRLKKGATSFTWTNLEGVEIRVVCRKWKRKFIGANAHAITATFEQVVA